MTAVAQHQSQVGFFYGLPRARDANFFDHIVRIAQPRRVDDVQGHAFKLYGFAHRVACGASNVSDDGHVFARQGVHQAGFAHIRLTN